jgi:hypothetical protein
MNECRWKGGCWITSHCSNAFTAWNCSPPRTVEASNTLIWYCIHLLLQLLVLLTRFRILNSRHSFLFYKGQTKTPWNYENSPSIPPQIPISIHSLPPQQPHRSLSTFASSSLSLTKHCWRSDRYSWKQQEFKTCSQLANSKSFQIVSI